MLRKIGGLIVHSAISAVTFRGVNNAIDKYKEKKEGKKQTDSEDEELQNLKDKVDS
jgi:hypothetical protein